MNVDCAGLVRPAADPCNKASCPLNARIAEARSEADGAVDAVDPRREPALLRLRTLKRRPTSFSSAFCSRTAPLRNCLGCAEPTRDFLDPPHPPLLPRCRLARKEASGNPRGWVTRSPAGSAGLHQKPAKG